MLIAPSPMSSVSKTSVTKIFALSGISPSKIQDFPFKINISQHLKFYCTSFNQMNIIIMHINIDNSTFEFIYLHENLFLRMEYMYHKTI